MCILAHAPLAHFAAAEQAFENQKRVRDFRPDSRLASVFRPFPGTQGLMAMAFVMDKILGVRRVLADDVCLPGIGSVASHLGLVAV